MDWAVYQPRTRFDIDAEREEYDCLFQHPARALQDRLVRRGGGDRTKIHAIPEWKKIYRTEAHARALLRPARVLGWGKEKRYDYAHKHS